MRGDSGVAGEGRVVGVPKFHGESAPCYQLRLDVQCFLWPAYYLYYILCGSFKVASWGVTRKSSTPATWVHTEAYLQSEVRFPKSRLTNFPKPLQSLFDPRYPAITT